MSIVKYELNYYSLNYTYIEDHELLKRIIYYNIS